MSAFETATIHLLLRGARDIGGRFVLDKCDGPMPLAVQLLMRNSSELVRAAKELGVAHKLLTGEAATEYIKSVFDKFDPEKVTGHLSIGESSQQISLSSHEFSYSQQLDQEAGFVFFDQDGSDQGVVFVIDDVRRLCRLMENSFGMEYFLSNSQLNYLFAVNWYVIEACGSVEGLFES